MKGSSRSSSGDRGRRGSAVGGQVAYEARQERPRTVRALDLFAGVGGSSLGATQAGVRVVGAVDSWALAHKTYRANFASVKAYARRCETLSISAIKRDFGTVNLLIASPECTSHTCAKGAARRSERSRETALQVVRFARVLRPRWILVENVVSMRVWRRYRAWLRSLEDLGYKYREQVLNAADFGVPQSRRRLFILFDKKSMPPTVAPSKRRRVASVRDVISTNGAYPFTPLVTKRRARATLQRARRALRVVSTRTPFLLVYYGSDGAGGWQTINVPLRTVTTVDRFAYVRRRAGIHEMRMLQVPELQRAMGFPLSYRLEHGTRRDKVKLLGNAVCPPVMKAVVATLVGRRAKTNQGQGKS